MSLLLRTRQIDRREWWLWALAVVVTIALTATIVLLTFFPQTIGVPETYWSDLREWVRGLAGLVLLFDIYTMYQHRQLQRVRRELADKNELFHLITENAADMIAVVDSQGRRIYNSPSYATVLGYSPDELGTSVSTEQIHPSDRMKVIEAAAKARATGRGERLEYRMRHKDGSWRILESTASPISDDSDAGSLVIVNRDITDRKRAEELVAHNAFHDGLTGLPNRLLFVDRLRQVMMRQRRRKYEGVAVLLVDIDEFKVVNDSLGHSAGDQLLVEVAHRLEDCLDKMDTASHAVTACDVQIEEKTQGLARFGGDEFIILLEDVSTAMDAMRTAQRIQETLTLPFVLNEHSLVVKASIGVASLSPSHARPEDLIRDAELAMYRAKRTGKARCEVFDPEMNASALKRLKLETELRRGMEQGEVVVFYQPIISLRTGKIAGFEALSRWQRPEGMVLPSDFIPVAEETGLILPMNNALMIEAFSQVTLWQLSFGSPLSMSINITPRQFEREELVQEVQAILKRTGSHPNSIHLEITETVAMQDADAALARLSELKRLGIHISIDDFGTGFSSLSRLRRFPVDALKIDRVFISHMGTDRESLGIVRLIIALAHSMGLQVVAEGTETAEQVAELTNLGCEMAQGFLYSPPVSSEKACELLQRDYGVPKALNTRASAAHAG